MNMNNEEAIEYAKATNYCAGCTDYECIDDDCKDCEHKSFFKMAIEALEKQDKYRWHDLKKNPNDLPLDEGEVICCEFYADGKFSYDVAAYSNDLYSVDKYDFYDKKGQPGFYDYDSEYGYYETTCHWWKYIDAPEIN